MGTEKILTALFNTNEILKDTKIRHIIHRFKVDYYNKEENTIKIKVILNKDLIDSVSSTLILTGRWERYMNEVLHNLLVDKVIKKYGIDNGYKSLDVIFEINIEDDGGLNKIKELNFVYEGNRKYN